MYFVRALSNPNAIGLRKGMRKQSVVVPIFKGRNNVQGILSDFCHGARQRFGPGCFPINLGAGAVLSIPLGML